MDGEEREKRLILINVCELNLTKLGKIVIIVPSINDWDEIALCVYLPLRNNNNNNNNVQST